MNINLNRRCFLKKSIISFVFVLFFFNKKYSFYIKGRRIENLELIKNFNFAKKKYHQETINLIFRGFLNKKNSSMNIVYNIEKRRNLSNLIYKKNIKFLI
tara:strand:- start:520 stop:819 length:300 start_codon:yes stop_codon:yes gene_type:complete